MTNPNINQFSQLPVLGQMDLEFAGSVVSGQVDSTQATALIAGQPVKIVNSVGGAPKVIALASQTDNVFAFVARNLKDATFPAITRLELALRNSVMYMNSGGAIARGGAVNIDINNVGNVLAWDGTSPVIGWAYDEATAANQLIRVYIEAPTGTGASNGIKSLNVTATLAQINAGLVLIQAQSGKKITVTNYVARVTGTFATGTAVVLESTNASPVLVTTLAEAGLTNGAVLTPASGNTTLGAGFATPLGFGDGLQVVNSGTAQTGGTNIQFTINYVQA